jgi:ABC-type phosphate transport system permease subunit
MSLTKRILLAIAATPFIVFGVWLALEAGKYLGEKQNEAVTFHIENSSGSELMSAMLFAGFVVVVMIVLFTLKRPAKSGEE